jgi:hypothetical protein
MGPIRLNLLSKLMPKSHHSSSYINNWYLKYIRFLAGNFLIKLSLKNARCISGLTRSWPTASALMHRYFIGDKQIILKARQLIESLIFMLELILLKFISIFLTCMCAKEWFHKFEFDEQETLTQLHQTLRHRKCLFLWTKSNKIYSSLRSCPIKIRYLRTRFKVGIIITGSGPQGLS